MDTIYISKAAFHFINQGTCLFSAGLCGWTGSSSNSVLWESEEGEGDWNQMLGSLNRWRKVRSQAATRELHFSCLFYWNNAPNKCNLAECWQYDVSSTPSMHPFLRPQFLLPGSNPHWIKQDLFPRKWAVLHRSRQNPSQVYPMPLTPRNIS